MERKNKKSISDLMGPGIGMIESEKSFKKKEEAFFLELIESLKAIEVNSVAADNLGISLVMYEELHLTAIELLLKQIFGEFKSNLVMWWVFEQITEEGDIITLIDKDGKEYVLKTPLQLYKFLKTV
jgi:hypothetical protein